MFSGSWTQKSTENYLDNIERLKEALKAADAIVTGQVPVYRQVRELLILGSGSRTMVCFNAADPVVRILTRMEL